MACVFKLRFSRLTPQCPARAVDEHSPFSVEIDACPESALYDATISTTNPTFLSSRENTHSFHEFIAIDAKGIVCIIIRQTTPLNSAHDKRLGLCIAATMRADALLYGFLQKRGTARISLRFGSLPRNVTGAAPCKVIWLPWRIQCHAFMANRWRRLSQNI